MLKRFVLSKLTSVFGKYVDGLDEQSLQVGVWSGERITDSGALRSWYCVR